MRSDHSARRIGDDQDGTQDLGTGTRTAILAVAADTLGLTPQQINLLYGDTQYPPSGGLGGSTNDWRRLFDHAACCGGRTRCSVRQSCAALGVTPEQLEAVKG